jgi:dTDP-4-dehydrorhamnose 3,5-epimerase
VANGYQTLESNVAYTYLVNAHWSPESKYTFVNLFDPEVGIEWPIAREDSIVSDKDMAHPMLKDVIPMEV